MVMLPRPFLQNVCSLFQRRLDINFGFDWPCNLEKQVLENNGHIHVYSPGAGTDKPPVVIF